MHSKLSCEYGVGEKTSKRYKFEKTHVHASSLENGLNKL